MKIRIFAFLLTLFLMNVLLSQADSVPFPDTPKVTRVPHVVPSPESEKAYEMFDLEVHPSFPGGQEALLQYLSNNITYPNVARTYNIQGTVAATFVVNIDGSISDAAIVKDIGGGCGEEVLRVLSLMPNWLPGEVDGQPVRVRFTLPVRFRLEVGKPKRKKD